MRGETTRSARWGTWCTFQSTPLMRGETFRSIASKPLCRISIHSPHARGDKHLRENPVEAVEFQSTPLMRGETLRWVLYVGFLGISIHSPHARGDSISLQKSVQIYVSLHNKTMIHRFSGLYKPLLAAQSPIFGVRNPRKSHDSFTFARPSAGRGITP